VEALGSRSIAIKTQSKVDGKREKKGTRKEKKTGQRLDQS
jgi:hypothetical protein